MVNYFCNSLDSALKKDLVDLTVLEGSAIGKLRVLFDERVADKERLGLSENDVIETLILTLLGNINELERCRKLLKMWLQ